MVRDHPGLPPVGPKTNALRHRTGGNMTIEAEPVVIQPRNVNENQQPLKLENKEWMLP